jgi:hypothetical protein
VYLFLIVVDVVLMIRFARRDPRAPRRRSRRTTATLLPSPTDVTAEEEP